MFYLISTFLLIVLFDWLQDLKKKKGKSKCTWRRCWLPSRSRKGWTSAVQGKNPDRYRRFYKKMWVDTVIDR